MSGSINPGIIFIACFRVVGAQFGVEAFVAFAGQLTIAFEWTIEKKYAAFKEGFSSLGNKDLRLNFLDKVK